MIKLSDLTKQYSNPTMKSLGAKPGQVIPNPYVRAFAPIEEAESDHEVSMAQNSLDTIIKNATELKQKIGSIEKNLPGWIQDHITNSENYIEQANSGYHELSEYIDDQGNERAAVGLPQTKEKEEVNEDCGCSSKPINENVANTILKQLGGNRFLVMTGAKTLTHGVNFLSFKLPKAKGGINYVKITLTDKDLYDIDFGSLRGVRYVIKKSVDDVFAEELPYVFTQYTGLYTSL